MLPSTHSQFSLERHRYRFSEFRQRFYALQRGTYGHEGIHPNPSSQELPHYTTLSNHSNLGRLDASNRLTAQKSIRHIELANASTSMTSAKFSYFPLCGDPSQFPFLEGLVSRQDLLNSVLYARLWRVNIASSIGLLSTSEATMVIRIQYLGPCPIECPPFGNIFETMVDI